MVIEVEPIQLFEVERMLPVGQRQYVHCAICGLIIDWPDIDAARDRNGIVWPVHRGDCAREAGIAEVERAADFLGFDPRHEPTIVD